MYSHWKFWKLKFWKSLLEITSQFFSFISAAQNILKQLKFYPLKTSNKAPVSERIVQCYFSTNVWFFSSYGWISGAGRSEQEGFSLLQLCCEEVWRGGAVLLRGPHGHGGSCGCISDFDQLLWPVSAQGRGRLAWWVRISPKLVRAICLWSMSFCCTQEISVSSTAWISVEHFDLQFSIIGMPFFTSSAPAGFGTSGSLVVSLLLVINISYPADASLVPSQTTAALSLKQARYQQWCSFLIKLILTVPKYMCCRCVQFKQMGRRTK